MKERPILFSAPMIRAILAGRKSMTRRVIRPQFMGEVDFVRANVSGQWCGHAHGEPGVIRGWRRCPYGAAGDRLWVKEGLRRGAWEDADDAVLCAADDEPAGWDFNRPATWVWKRPTLPSIHMPRGLSRLTLEVTGVRVERLQAITGADVLAEGIGQPWNERGIVAAGGMTPKAEAQLRALFNRLWDEINGSRPGASWQANPFVFAVSFRRLGAGEGA